MRKAIVSVSFVALMIAGLIGDCLVAPLWWAGAQYHILLTIHGISCAVLGAALYYYLKSVTPVETAVFRPIFFFCFIIVCGFSFIGVVLAALFYAGVRAGSGPLKTGFYREEIERYLQEYKERAKHVAEDIEIMRSTRGEIDFDSFVDIIRTGSVRMKAKVIDRLAHNLSRDNIFLLREALADSSHEVRLFAASAFFKSEATMSRKIEAATEAAYDHGGAREFSFLGDLDRDYADSGLLEPKLAAHFLRRAAEAYAISLDMDTNQPTVMGHYIRCLMALGENARGLALLNSALKMWPDDRRLHFLQAEGYFRNREWANVSSLFDSALDGEDYGPKAQEVANFWKKLA
ncbi:MAG TPA: tetratricopeptide repeat protein [bacterium]|nr:tetratricopeptide repeat protein [bacterium]